LRCFLPSPTSAVAPTVTVTGSEGFVAFLPPLMVMAMAGLHRIDARPGRGPGSRGCCAAAVVLASRRSVPYDSVWLPSRIGVVGDGTKGGAESGRLRPLVPPSLPRRITPAGAASDARLRRPSGSDRMDAPVVCRS